MQGKVGQLFLLVCVTASGAGVMLYEFIAVRILQRYFGGSLDVWASEIAVCLAGLSLGYAVGGRIADRYRTMSVLGIELFVSGLLGASILKLAEFAGERTATIEVGLAWHPLLAAGVSSFLPFLALGTVLPQAIRLRVKDIERVGESAGNVIALSTIGSILGVLAAGMWLLPHFGVRETLYATSAVLIVLGAAAIAVDRGRLGASSLAFLLLTFSGFAEAQIVFEDYSAYHHILVEDDGDTRILRFDNEQESLMSKSNPYEGGFEYTDFFHVPMVLDPTINRVLFVGLGGGTGPKSFYKMYPEIQIEVVEIDPMVAQVARSYFRFPRSARLRVKIADGRDYIRRSQSRYGLIVMDAYSTNRRGGYLPYHLATREFFEIASGKLVNGGCLVYNIITDYGGGTVLRDVATTLMDVFYVVYAFEARTSANTVLVAMKIDLAALREDGTRDGLGWPRDPWLQHPLGAGNLQALAWDLSDAAGIVLPGLDMRMRQMVRVRPGRRILTDNYAPVD